ncbi:fasciclin domain-containing protein [Algibacter sp. L4_22]|uniref:fasciclin domain-containing protein n=1 Tax=Algibacter sp. L4_22 TaxID=2942477 RepID=UPI00201B78B9|nr:fasciclin domain-containing protein [Algibacter sp. L4_22]MCL5129804.1 fasciclin domain-containing protein [Algibacter sp. L4_22]
MNNKHNFIINFGRICAVLVILVAFSCKDDTMDEHYGQEDKGLESSILETLSSDTNYSTFVELVKQAGFEELLNSSQAFTVWAPNNDALALVSSDVLNDPDALTELIGNHISRFSYGSTINESPLFVKMLNDKSIEFSNIDGQVTFGDVDLLEKDILTSNGILHKLSSVLSVKPNIWGFLNDNETEFPTLMDYFSQYNETLFDEAKSVKTGTNSLGQTVYDSIFSSSNTQFKTIGDLSSEDDRFTFIGLTDDAYAGIYDTFKEYYQYPVEDSVKSNTDRTIFSNLTFPVLDLEDLNGSLIENTVGNSVLLDGTGTSVESLSNGNVFVVNTLNYDAKNVMYKPIRYEVENNKRREIGSLTDFSVVQKYQDVASGKFTNIVSLLANPENGNDYFEVAFSNVLSASYNINLKFSAIGAAQDTQLKFEFSYVDASGNTVVNNIDSMVISNLEEGIVPIGDTYDIPVYINEEIDNEYTVKLKIIIDVSEPELILYERKFGLDYVELTPVE